MREKNAAQHVRKTPAPFASSLKSVSAMSSSSKSAFSSSSLSKKNTYFNSASKFGSLNKNYMNKNNSGAQDPLAQTVKQHHHLPTEKPPSPMDTYEISDREDSETDDSDSEAENDKQKKRIPLWAQRQNLYKSLEEQVNGRIDGRKVDPDDIFPEVQSCDLEAIFGNQKKKNYRSRNSSGNWTRDKVTAAEKLVYKRQMGFTRPEESEI